MDTSDLNKVKLNLVRFILNEAKPNTIQELIRIIDVDQRLDWWQELTEDDQLKIENSLKEINSQKTTSHATVMEELDQYIKLRKK